MNKVEVGKRFGRLTTLERVDDAVSANGRRRSRWLCQCDCGNKKIVFAENLTGGKTESCGCLQKERASFTNASHGDTDSKLYNVWCAMKRRCYNPRVKEYPLYGGRGITVCDEWRENYASFMDWSINNGYDKTLPRGKCTLDRIDNNGNYSPDNCRWVDQKTQMNNVGYNHYETYEGETHTIAEWADLYNIPYAKLLQRLTRYGYDIGKALNKK